MTKLMSVTAVIDCTIRLEYRSSFIQNCYHLYHHQSNYFELNDSQIITFHHQKSYLSKNPRTISTMTMMAKSKLLLCFVLLLVVAFAEADTTTMVCYSMCIFEPRCFPLLFFSCFVLFCTKYRNQQ